MLGASYDENRGDDTGETRRGDTGVPEFPREKPRAEHCSNCPDALPGIAYVRGVVGGVRMEMTGMYVVTSKKS